MQKQIQQAFDQVRASDELKDKTKQFLAQNRSARAPKPVWRWAAVVCAVLLLLCGAGGWAYWTPVAAISLDINPSLELRLNRFDQVIQVVGFNESGQQAAGGMHLRFSNYADAVRQILSDEQIQPYLTEDSAISITVASPNEAKNQEMLTQLSACAAEYGDVYCCATNWEQTAQAHDAGMSFGKYQAFLELQALAPQVTPEQVQGLTMRQIRDWIGQLAGDAQQAPAGQGQGYGSGAGAGGSSGAGQGYGPHKNGNGGGGNAGQGS